MDKIIIFKIERIANGYIVSVEHDILDLKKRYFDNSNNIADLVKNDLDSMY